MNAQSFLRHADVAAGVVVFLLVGFAVRSESAGLYALIAGAAAYFAVNRYYRPARQ